MSFGGYLQVGARGEAIRQKKPIALLLSPLEAPVQSGPLKKMSANSAASSTGVCILARFRGNEVWLDFGFPKRAGFGFSLVFLQNRPNTGSHRRKKSGTHRNTKKQMGKWAPFHMRGPAAPGPAAFHPYCTDS